MTNILTQTDWDRIQFLIEYHCKSTVRLVGAKDEGYTVMFDGGCIHPVHFLDLFSDIPGPTA